MELDEIARRVAAGWPFTPESYPSLADATNPETQQTLKRQHVLVHLMKQLGAIAAAHEKACHGDTSAVNDRAAMAEAAGKLLTSTVQMALMLHLESKDIEVWIDAYFPSVREI